MKKLLGIVVLSFLLSGCTTTQDYVNSNKMRVGATKSEIRSVFLAGWSMSNDPWGHGCNLQYFPNYKMEILSATTQDLFLVFENVTLQQQKLNSSDCSGTNLGNGTLKAWVPTLSQAVQIVQGKKADKKIVRKNQPTKDDIEPFKVTCRNIGYTDGTEKFSDCVKDLYLKSLEVQNQTQQQSTTTSIPKTSVQKKRIDPTVWDDLLKLGGISSGTSSSSSSSSTSMPKGTCYNTGEEIGGTNKSCKYSCSGNIVTTTISALQICPLHIQR